MTRDKDLSASPSGVPGTRSQDGGAAGNTDGPHPARKSPIENCVLFR